MADENVLRARAREAMKSGDLPEQPPDRMWGGPGSGASCAVCGKIVGPKEVEFELQFSSSGGAGPLTYHVHARCFAAWELERRKGCSNGNSLSEVGGAGIIRGREHSGPSRGERG